MSWQGSLWTLKTPANKMFGPWRRMVSKWVCLQVLIKLIIGSAEALPILCVSDFCESQRERERERRL